MQVLEEILVQDVSLVGKVLARVAKSVAADKRLLIGQVLVRVASADGIITKGEFRALERVFKALEIPPKTLEDLILQICPATKEAKIKEANHAVNGHEVIPCRDSSMQTTGVGLDMARVSAITNETKQVIELLSSVMDGEQEHDETAVVKTAAENKPNGETRPAVLNRENLPAFDGLDVAYHPILRQLLAKDAWSAAELGKIAAECQVMPLKIYDTINEWADEALGDLLLEGEDPILVRRELIRNDRDNKSN